MAYANLAARCLDRSRPDEAASWAGRALELAERLGDTDTALDATVTLAVCDSNQHAKLERGPRARA